LISGHHKIKLGPIKAKQFSDQLEIDANFLRDMKIMDYSLLLGIHYRDRTNSAKKKNSLSVAVASATPEIQKKRFSITKVTGDSLPPFPVKIERMDCIFQRDESGFASTNNNNEETNELYFMGIIDILQPYDLRKQLEHSIKSFRYDRHQISAVNPREYCDRFLNFIKRNTENDEIPGTSSSSRGNTTTSSTTTTQLSSSTQDTERNPHKTGNSTS